MLDGLELLRLLLRIQPRSGCIVRIAGRAHWSNDLRALHWRYDRDVRAFARAYRIAAERGQKIEEGGLESNLVKGRLKSPSSFADRVELTVSDNTPTVLHWDLADNPTSR